MRLLRAPPDFGRYQELSFRIDYTNIQTIIIDIVTSRTSFELVYAVQVQSHLKAIDRKFHSLIRREIENQLRFEPDVETRNRKPLTRAVGFGADWELRCGPNNRFRVFYGVNQAEREVGVIAIGLKRGNRVFIGGEEVEL